MKKYTSKEILENLNEQGILTRNDYTFVEYVDQLMKFQEATAKLVIGEENVHLIRMTEVISRCEAMAREKNLYYDSKVIEGLRALRVINKEIAVSMAGKHGEDRVADTYQYVTRPDARFFRNVYISDGIEETEIDSVVLTRNGFIILEIKNAKEDITLAQDGRILFNNSSCYHDISIGEKIDKKRRLLKKRLKAEFENRGIDKEIKIESLLVFSTPKGVRIHVHDQFKQESYCFRGSLFNRIDGFRSSVQYTDEELAVMDEILQHIETEQKRFAPKFDSEEVKRAFAVAYEELTYVPEAESKVVGNREQVKEKTTFAGWLKRYSCQAAAAGLIVVSGVALGVISKIWK